ncbi:hypothetical protein FZC78_21725 [Rossellomorea vietnamensis]|uniref:Uncharacterized protein n=1 Tax=Rossellomorea vietnamensis TaxID=218284 RepID=A0A5D4NI55_9BACI|nr:hypothetical protein FZC78_21725 [Rossellomorea vietnamensis]
MQTHACSRFTVHLYSINFKSGSALISPGRQMFQREKKAVFPCILQGLFDPEGLGAGAGFRNAP